MALIIIKARAKASRAPGGASRCPQRGTYDPRGVWVGRWGWREGIYWQPSEAQVSAASTQITRDLYDGHIFAPLQNFSNPSSFSVFENQVRRKHSLSMHCFLQASPCFVTKFDVICRIVAKFSNEIVNFCFYLLNICTFLDI